MTNFSDWIANFYAGTGINILTALVILTGGLLGIKVVTRLTRILLQRTPVERTTMYFLVSIINFVLYAVVFYFTIDALVPNVSAGLVAVLGSAALAVGLALKDSLSDFASGIMIIFNKPFKEGDYICADGIEGTIRSIHLLYTVLYTGDNKKVILNNSRVSNNQIINYSARPTRRVDMTFTAGYGSDIEHVKKVLKEIADKHPLILDNPDPVIRLVEQGASALVFRFRVWVNNSDYWTVWYDVTEEVYKRFNEENIDIPYQNVTLHLDSPVSIGETKEKEENKQIGDGGAK